MKKASVTELPLPVPSDPLNVNNRLYRQISKLLDDIEHGKGELTIREKIAAFAIIGRIQTVLMGLRQEGSEDHVTAGSAVRKYATAFAAHDARRRKKDAGPKPLEFGGADVELYDESGLDGADPH